MVSRPARIRVQIHTPKGSIEPPCSADPRRACCAASCRSSRCRLSGRCPPPLAAAARAVAGPPDTPPLSAALSRCCTHGMLKAPVSRAHACVRYGCLGRVWRTLCIKLCTALDRPFRRCASRHCRLDGPCLAQNNKTPKTRQRRAARARRAALAVSGNQGIGVVFDTRKGSFRYKNS